MSAKDKLGRYHAAVWNEPVVMELGHPGRRGQIYPATDPKIRKAVGEAKTLIAPAMRRRQAPALPELSEPEVQRHAITPSKYLMVISSLIWTMTTNGCLIIFLVSII